MQPQGNRIKSEHLDQVRNYIGKKRSLYTSHCEEEDARETAIKKKYKRISFDLKRQPPCATQRPSRNKNDTCNLPPNLYNVQHIPFAEKRGSHGAYWQKPFMHKSLRQASNLPQVKPHFKFYNLERNSDRCVQNKGVFLPNARERRATTRCMINSVAGCFHDPSEPGPEQYFPQNFMLAHNASPVIKAKRPEIFTFIPNTSVPETSNSIHQKRKLCPYPGYYETRYPNIASCKLHRLVFMPELQLIIDRQKRLKFRRQHYTKIKARQYFSPDWHHVIGHGHRRLFKLYHSWRALKDVLKKEIKTHKDINKGKEIKEPLKIKPKMYPDHRYISMINNPNRRPISLREKDSFSKRPPTERYNTKQKTHVIIRRKIKGCAKRIAFNSGQERFKNSERPPPLTPQQLKKLKRSLPLELRMRNYPIMTKQPDEIHSKVTSIPKRLLPPEDLDQQKRLFKFSPVPTGKILVSINEMHISSAEEYYDRKLDPTLYFRTENRKTLL